MMTRTVLFFLFFASTMLSLRAQAPGYLGKKATLLINVPSFPTIWGPTWNNRGLSNHYGDDGGGMAISPKLDIELGYTISRHQTLVASYSLWRTGMEFTTYTPTNNPSASFEKDEHYLFYQLSMKTFALGRKKFNLQKGALAPLGAYTAMTLQYTKVKGEIADKRTSYFGGEDVFGHQAIEIDPEAIYYALGFEFGAEQIYWDRLITNIGIRLNLPLNYRRLGYAIEGYDSNPDSNLADENQDSYYQEVFERLAMHSMVQFNLGVGLLLF